jgi:type IV secretion system protein VirB2
MSIKNSLRVFFTFLYLLCVSANNSSASTQTTDNAIETTLCNVVNSLTGGIGRSVATIAIIALAIGLFLGKLSWGLALATALGIAMVFGAPTVVVWLSKGVDGPGGGSDKACETTQAS